MTGPASHITIIGLGPGNPELRTVSEQSIPLIASSCGHESTPVLTILQQMPG
jgi:hypothetical protein